MTTFADVACALRSRHHLSSNRCAVLDEFLGIDVLAVETRGARLVHGYEVKVSRSDWLKELKRPEKSEPGMAYCDRWYLAAPPGVIKPGELPKNWGHVEIGPTGCVLRKRAPALRLVELPEQRYDRHSRTVSPAWLQRTAFSEMARRASYAEVDRVALLEAIPDLHARRRALQVGHKRSGRIVPPASRLVYTGVDLTDLV